MLEGYGITECSPVVSCSPMHAPVAGSIGTLLSHVEGAIVDLGLTRRVAVGESGMLLVRGPSIFPGYLHHDGEPPFVEFEGKSWYRTGDLVRDTRGRSSTSTAGSSGSSSSAARWSRCRPSNPSCSGRWGAAAKTAPHWPLKPSAHADTPDVVLFTTFPTDRATANAAIKEAGMSALHHIRQVIQIDTIPLLGTGKTDYRELKSRYTTD